MKATLFVVLTVGDPDDALAEIRCENAKIVPEIGDTIIFDGMSENQADDMEGRVVRREFRMGAFGHEIMVIAEPVQ